MDTATIFNADSDATSWHALAVDDVVRRLGTDTAKGLGAAEIDQRLKKYGKSALGQLSTSLGNFRHLPR